MNNPDLMNITNPLYIGQQAVEALEMLFVDGGSRHASVSPEAMSCLLGLIADKLKEGVQAGNAYEQWLMHNTTISHLHKAA